MQTSQFLHKCYKLPLFVFAKHISASPALSGSLAFVGGARKPCGGQKYSQVWLAFLKKPHKSLHQIKKSAFLVKSKKIAERDELLNRDGHSK